ncbi:MAG: hypothetical protein ACE5HX_06365 [bacterium]
MKIENTPQIFSKSVILVAIKSLHPPIIKVKINQIDVDENREVGEMTFIRRPISVDHEIDRLTKSVTLNNLNRQIFQKPSAGMLFSTVTQLQSAPFLTTLYVQLLPHPAWKRVVHGDYDSWIKADAKMGAGSEETNRPYVMERDVAGKVYDADTANHCIVVLRLAGMGKDTELKYQIDFDLGEFTHPLDVVWHDAEMPFDSADDIIWVAGKPEQSVAKYPLEVVGQFTDLNPTVNYEIKADFYNKVKVGYYLKQNIIVDNAIIFDEFEVSSGLKDVDWMQLPGELSAN